MNDTYAAKEITAALVDALKHQGLCLKEALRLIEKGEEMAERIRVPMVITVVDQGGNMVAMHRMDDSLLASISISCSKAYTAAALRAPTDFILETTAKKTGYTGIDTVFPVFLDAGSYMQFSCRWYCAQPLLPVLHAAFGPAYSYSCSSFFSLLGM